MKRIVLLPMLCLAACGPSTTPPAPTWNRDVGALVTQKCAGCHREGGIGPFPLTTRDEVIAMSGAVRSAVESRRMPPVPASRACADYAMDPSLSDSQLAQFTAWLDEGAPLGDGTARLGTPPSDVLAKVDLALAPSEPYTQRTAPDDYRCFVLEWPRVDPVYVTGFRAKPGNPQTVHHVIAYLMPPELAKSVRDADTAEAGPGYTCFGGPGGEGEPAWLGAWAPGGSGGAYPLGTGIKVQPGSVVVLQVHYSARALGQPADSTGIEVSLADRVDVPATIQPFTNPRWVGTDVMKIPAHEPAVTHTYGLDFTTWAGIASKGVLPSSQALKIHAVGLHQHLLGTSSRLSLTRTDGSEECLLDIPKWDFHWQRSYGFTKPKVIRPGDLLNISCTWNNSAEAQPMVNGQRPMPRDVTWGEGTGDEMCLGILFMTK